MKNNFTKFIILQVFFTSFFQFSYGQGSFPFTKTNWEDLKLLAKRENQMALVIVTSKKCNACENFEKFVLSQTSVIDFYKTFLNILVDVTEIPDSVQAGISQEELPLLIYFDNKGSLVHTALASMEAEEFIEHGVQAKEAAIKLPAFHNQYIEGNLSPSFLYEYAFLLKNANQNTEEVAEDYLKTQTDEQLLEEPNQFFILNFSKNPSDHAFQFMLKNLDQFKKDMSEELVENHLTEVIGNMYAESILSKDKSLFNSCIQLIQKVFPDKANFMVKQMTLNFYSALEDYTKYAQFFLNAHQTENFPNDEIYHHLSILVLKVKDLALIDRLKTIAQELTFSEPNYQNQLLMANFYFKLGKKKEAKTTCETAIKMAQNSRKSYIDATELLERIKNL